MPVSQHSSSVRRAGTRQVAYQGLPASPTLAQVRAPLAHGAKL